MKNSLIEKLKDKGIKINSDSSESIADGFFYTIKASLENNFSMVYLGPQNIIYSKRGILTEDKINQAFKILKQKSLEDKCIIKDIYGEKFPLRIFLFEYTPKMIEGFEGDSETFNKACTDFKTKYLNEYKSFLEKTQDESEKKTKILEDIDTILESIKSPFEQIYANHFNLGSQMFECPGEKTFYLNLPNTFQIFNFNGFRIYKPEEEKEALELISSYHQKRRWDYDRSGDGKYKLIERGELTEKEKQVYKENVPHMKRALELLKEHSKKIVCAPLLLADEGDGNEFVAFPHASHEFFNMYYESKHSEDHYFLV